MILRRTYILLLLGLLSWSIQAQPRLTHRSLTDVFILSQDSMQGRRTGTEGAFKARKYIISRYEEVGILSFNEGYKSTFSFKNNSGELIEGTNVIGYLPGESDQYVVISAHYDHEGMKNGYIYNGADDNASGVAGLLAIAEYVSNNPSRFSYIFCAFDAEELGLRGAKSFVKKPPVPLDKIVLNINLDMISHNFENEIYASGTYHNPSLIPLLQQVIEQTSVKLLLGHDKPSLGYADWTSSSDHQPFFKKGIPHLYFGVEDHEDYHKPTDTYDKINHQFFLDVVDMLKLVVKTIDQNFSPSK